MAAIIKVDNRIIEIIKDLSDRKALRQAWESIDNEVQEEIMETWLGIINDCPSCKRKDAFLKYKLLEFLYTTEFKYDSDIVKVELLIKEIVKELEGKK